MSREHVKDLRHQDRSTRMAEVLRLKLMEGMGIKKIHRETGLNPKTIRALLGSANREKAAPKAAEPRHSILDPYNAELRRLLEDSPEMRAPGMLEQLRARGYEGGISILRDRLAQLRPRPKREAFFTRSYEPGKMLQVDWADFGYAIPGSARRVSAFVAALAYSRYLFIIFTLSQQMGTFLRCMDQALQFFGGRTLVDLFDNMKTVVTSHVGQAVQFNPRFVEYARAKGLAVRACTPRKPTEKPYVERPIGFVRTRFWPGRHPVDLFDLNAQATKWRDDLANNRIHEDTGKVPSLVFKNEEKPLLLPLLTEYFDTDDLVSTGISKTFRVDFDRNDYTAPWRLNGQQVLVRGNEHQVSIYLGDKQVAVHNRCWDVGKVIKDDSHERGLLEEKRRTVVGAVPPELCGLGDSVAEYFKILAANNRSLRKEIQRLVLLTELFDNAPVSAAIRAVMATGHVGAEYVEYVLRQKMGLVPGPAALKLDNGELDGIRLSEPDLAIYDKPRKTLDPGEKPEGAAS